MEDVFSFHLYFPSLEPSAIFSAADEAARESEMDMVKAVSGRWPTRAYGAPGCPPLVLAFSMDDPWCQAELAYVHPPQFHCYGAERMVRLLTSICDRLHARLGRSHGGGGHGLVQPGELDGDLQAIEWLQYLSPVVVQRWGLEHLLKGPFPRALATNNGACLILLGDDPFKLPLPKSAAAAYLDIPTTRLSVS